MEPECVMRSVDVNPRSEVAKSACAWVCPHNVLWLQDYTMEYAYGLTVCCDLCIVLVDPRSKLARSVL
eukprot:6213841-Pleurochrysis_carterae.AAC.4